MKQRFSVRAIIVEDNKVFMLKRASGRPSILGKYELPGGKLAYGEQPEDTLRRYLHDDVGLHIKSAQLFDAVTYIDHDDSSIQYIVIVYTVRLAEGRHPIVLSGNYSKYKWQSMSNLQQVTLTDLTHLLLGILKQDEIVHTGVKNNNDVKKSTNIDATVFTDGGSRGNPGPSAAGFVIFSPDNTVLEEGGEYLGITTNTQAEYHGVRLGLERATALGLKRVECRIDNMMVVNQLRGSYRIKNRELWPIHERIRELMKQFDSVSFRHVQRDFNRLADGMVNKTLDSQSRNPSDN